MGLDQAGNTSGWGAAKGPGSAGFFGPVLIVRGGHRGDELARFFEVRFLDEDLEFGQPVDGQGVDEGRRPAADDRADAVAFEEVSDQVRFERPVDAGGLDEVGFVPLGAAVVVLSHGRIPFRRPR